MARQKRILPRGQLRDRGSGTCTAAFVGTAGTLDFPPGVVASVLSRDIVGLLDDAIEHLAQSP